MKRFAAQHDSSRRSAKVRTGPRLPTRTTEEATVETPSLVLHRVADVLEPSVAADGAIVSVPDEPAERQADQVSQRWGTALRSGGFAAPPLIGQPVADRVAVQSRADGDGRPPVAADIANSIRGARGSGRPFSVEDRRPLEKGFGADFSRVRLHTDSQADRLNKRLDARAFTTGRDIFFRHGEFSTSKPKGQELLAHELTHIVQQGHASESSQQPLVVQRNVAIIGKTISKKEYGESHWKGIQEKIKSLQKKKKWDDNFAEKIKQKIESMIEEDHTYPGDNKHYKSYQDLIHNVAEFLEIGATPSTSTSTTDGPEPEAKPVARGTRVVNHGGEGLLPLLRRQASEMRKRKGDAEGDDFSPARKRRQLEERKLLKPGHEDPINVGTFKGLVRGQGNFLISEKTRQGQTYEKLWTDFSSASQLDKRSDTEAAKDIREMLHGDSSAILKHSHAALKHLDEILAVLAGAESSRATSAVVHFAAVIHSCTKGGGTLKSRFAGQQANFLPANQGGSKLLRGESVPELEGQKRRATEALNDYLNEYGKDMDLGELTESLQKNIQRYSFLRKTGGGSGTPAVS